MADRSHYQIVPIGSLAIGFALKVDGVIARSNPNASPLAAYVDAIMAGASELDADFIAKAIERRAWPPSYEERAAAVEPNDKHGPSLEPFKEKPHA
jgi:hypothetical protein